MIQFSGLKTLYWCCDNPRSNYRKIDSIFSNKSNLKPEVARVIAAGGAGTWFTFGYLIYIVVGVGVAVSALFYHYLEKVMQKTYSNSIISKALAREHLILMNVGTAVTSGMMMYAGYVSGAAMLPASIGGKGFNEIQAHQILGPFVVIGRNRVPTNI